MLVAVTTGSAERAASARVLWACVTMGTSARRFLLSVLCALVLVLALVNGVAARRRAAEEDEFEGGAGGGDATTASDLDDDLIGEDELLDDSFGDDDLATFAQDDEVDGVAGATSLDHDGGDTTPDVEDGGAVPVGGKKVDPEEPYVGTTSPLMFAGQFTLEYLAMGFIVLFGIVFVMGRMENENIAAAFERQCVAILSCPPPTTTPALCCHCPCVTFLDNIAKRICACGCLVVGSKRLTSNGRLVWFVCFSPPGLRSL